MDLSEESIQDFIDIWEKEFGERLTVGQAEIEAKNFLHLCWALYQPLPCEPGYREQKDDPFN